MPRIKLDQIDRRILVRLQRDATATLTQLAEDAALSSTACWRRIRRMEQAGIVGARVTLLSQDALGLKLTGFVTIRTSNHSEAWVERFAREVATLPSVLELHRMTGEVDYLLKIVAPDLDAYNDIYRASSACRT